MSDKIQLQTLVIDGSLPGPHLLITGGVHGDEFESMACIRQLGQVIVPDNLQGRVTLVPVVNEAAFIHGNRMAEDGLDLARVCPGDSQGSVTQRTAAALTELIQQSDYYIDLHSGGIAMEVWPMSGYTLHEDRNIRKAQRKMARAFNLPVIWGTAPNLDGRSLSVARDAGVPAIYTEYLGAGRCAPDGVAAYLEGCLNVMGHLNMIQRVQPESRVELEVEDPRPSSGHMQVQNPSPITGQFTAACTLGQAVRAGDVLGIVTSITGSESHEVICAQTGHVLAIRRFARVLEGDFVVVVLETEFSAPS